MLAADGRKRGSGVLGGVRLTYGLTYGREPKPRRHAKAPGIRRGLQP